MSNKELDKPLQNLPACAAEYIKLVIKKMRYRKKVRIDVMAELAAHFEDELRDCKDDTEKEQKAQKLIEQFGDAKLLGILLRRAKKRCRPLWRTALVRAFQAVSVFLIVYLVWFSSGRPVITVDYVAELNRIVRPAADESLNAAPSYQKAVELIEQHIKSSDEILNLMQSKKYEDANSEQRQLIEKWLTGNKEILDWVVAGTQKSYYWGNYTGQKVNEAILASDNLGRFRTLAYSLRWRIRLSAEQGRYKDVFDDIKTSYCFGQHIRKGDKPLIEQLVGIALEALSVQTLRGVLDKYQIDPATLAKLQKDFEQIIANENFVISLKADKLSLYDVIQRCFTENQLGGGHLYIPGFREITHQWERAIGHNKNRFDAFCANLLEAANFIFIQPNKKETLKTTNKLYDYFEKFALKTPAQIRAEKTKIDEEVKKITGDNLFIKKFSPAFEKIFQISHRSKTDVEATLTIVAILRYKQDKGQYPQSLDELKATGYIKEIPIDAFSDKPLVYRKMDSDFILYSVGLNFKDDGGDRKGKITNWADEGDAVFWPVQK